MAASLRGARKLPVLVILGATGSGKSKLAIELALKFNGEIISTDSMQVYKGLDIVTNKVTAGEQALCRHHMIAYLDPLHSHHTVTDFRNRALPIIDRLHREHKLPIIVGGTNYYIESLLWQTLIDKKDLVKNDSTNETTNAKSEASLVKSPTGQSHENEKSSSKNDESQSDNFDEVRILYKDWDNAQLHQRLMELDAEKARSIHRNDRRKIIRALEVYHEHGMKMSEILAEQHSVAGASHLSGPLRYPDTCILWLQCQQSVLDERCDKRVDSMLERGLLDEMHEFHQEYNRQRPTNERADYTHGIFQSIGFKEFHNYLLLPENERETEHGQKLLQEGIDALKMVTRRYARYQVKWMKNRFIKRPGANIPYIYAVDSTYPDQWEQDAYNPAYNIVQSFLQGETPAISPLPYQEETSNRVVHMICEACDGRLFVREAEWLAHINSRKHKKRMSSVRLKVKQEEAKKQALSEKSAEQLEEL